MKKIAALLVALTLMTLTACGPKQAEEGTSPSPSPSGSPTQETGQTAGNEKTLSLARFSEPKSLDPALVESEDDVMMCAHLFEGLMRWEDSGETTEDGQHTARLALGQAERYERTVAEDGTITYTFTLRPDAYWSDGKKVEAEDFVTAWRRLANSQGSAMYSYLLVDVKNAMDIATGAAQYDALGVSAPDARTFVVELEREDLDFLEVCAHPATAPLRMDVLERYQNKEWCTQVLDWVSNGPYVMSGWSQYSTIRMSRNPAYSPRREGPDFLLWRYAADEAAALSALQAGTIDFSRRAPAEGREELAQAGTLRETDGAGTYYLNYQTTAAPFDDARVRQAFTLAVDRTELVALDPAGGKAAGGLVPYGMGEEDFRAAGGDYYSTDPADYKDNCDLARTLLAQAGYPEGKDFPEVTYLYNDVEVHQKVAEALQTMWERELGVKVTLQGEAWEDYLHELSEGEYSIAKASWIADRNDPGDFLYLCDPLSSETWYTGEEFGALLRRAEETWGEARTRLYHQAEDVVVGRDWAVCPLYFYANRYLISSRLEGVYLDALGRYYFGTASKK